MYRFNLVIEVLVVSRIISFSSTSVSTLFQSRNRGTCRFKKLLNLLMVQALFRFNLVIEVLVVSRSPVKDDYEGVSNCFNLVIEVLVVSRQKSAGGQLYTISGFNLVIEVLVVSSFLLCSQELDCF